jgi:peptide/nickel transport system substrate-binding protein
MPSPVSFVNHRQPRRRSFALVAGLLGSALALAACGSSGSSPSSSASGSSDPTASNAALTNQTWLVPQDWGAIDPTQEAATNMGAILLVLEPLVLADGKGGVVANLATQTVPTPTKYVYTLRSGVKFSDGKPLTIADVLYSFQIHTAKNSKSNLAGNFSDVKSITTSGSNKLIITLKHADVEFPNYVAEVGIVEKSVREKAGPNPGSPGHLNAGTGPYTVSNYQPGNQVVLKRNPDYWGPKPAAEAITLRLIQDDNARLLATQSGSVTGTFEIPASEVPTYSRISGMHVIRGANPSVVMFNVNNTQKPWSDPFVRKAVAMAINKVGIVSAVLHNAGKPAVSVVQQSGMASLIGTAGAASLYQSLNLYPYNVANAKAELAKSSVPHGFSGTLIYDQAEQSSGLVAQAVAQELKAIGINLTVKSVPDGQYTNEVFFKHTAPPAIVDFSTDIPDPVSLANYLSNSVNTLAAGGYTDIAEYKNAAQDALLNKYLQLPTSQTSERGRLLSSALKNLAADEPYIPIYNADYLAVIKNNVNFNNFDGMWWMRRWTSDITAN